MNHVTPQQLQDYVDGFPAQMDKANIELHLRMCSECSDTLSALRLLDSAIHRVPLERVSEEFTRNIMKKLRIEKSPTYAWRIFENLAPILAFTVIVGIVFVLFQLTGAYENSELQQSVGFTRSIYSKVGGNVTDGLNAINGWMEKYLSFAFAKNSYGLTTFLLIFFAAVGLLDKYFLMPLLKKKDPLRI